MLCTKQISARVRGDGKKCLLTFINKIGASNIRPMDHIKSQRLFIWLSQYYYLRLSSKVMRRRQHCWKGCAGRRSLSCRPHIRQCFFCSGTAKEVGNLKRWGMAWRKRQNKGEAAKVLGGSNYQAGPLCSNVSYWVVVMPQQKECYWKGSPHDLPYLEKTTTICLFFSSAICS